MLNYIVIVLCTIIILLWILKKYHKYTTILLLAFVARLFIMTADLDNWFPIIHSGIDSENFHNIAVSNNRYTGEQTILTTYTIFLTFIYSITNCSRVIAQFINVLFGMGILFTFINTCRYLNINTKRIRIGLIILSFMPNMIIFSAILLREAWIQYFVALSLFAFIRWYTRGKLTQFIKCIIFTLIASLMHAGVLPILLVYAIAELIYNPKIKRFRLSLANITILGGLIIICILVLGSYINLFTSKFENISSDNISEVMSVHDSGGSTYLLWLPHTSNILLQIPFTLLRIIYFFFSPIPLDWRGLNDLIAFCIDTAAYIYLFYIICHNTTQPNIKPLKYFIIMAVLFSATLFAMGTNVAGTAMRHRSKFVEPLCIVFCISNLRYKHNKRKTYIYIS